MSPMNNRRMTPTQEPGILDFAPGAAAAYSLRNLSLAYTGPVVTVRRSTDDAEADFTASEVSDGTLAAWCGGGDGFVKQWWDQSGNTGRNGTQATAANQPQVVASGVVVTESGKPALDFSVSANASMSASVPITDINVFAVVSIDSYTLSPAICEFSKTGYRRILVTNNLGAFRFYLDGTDYLSAALFPAGRFVATYQHNATAFSMRINGATENESTVASPQTTDTLTIGNDLTLGNPMPAISELLIYPTDMTALRTRIEGNLAWYY